jgi:hypothetical protein
VADLVFNISKGKVAELAARVNANDPTNAVLLVIPVLASGVETDAVIRDKDTVSDVFSGATDEATAGGWNRKTLDQTGGVTITTDDTNDRQDVDCPDQTWTAVAAANNTSDLMFAYDSDSAAGTDANVVPCTWHDFAVTTDGSDITAQIATAGFFRAS